MCEGVCGDVLNLFFRQGIANQDGARGGNTSKPSVCSGSVLCTLLSV